ncbi:MAG: hypothetical protein Q8865_06525 [Bacillota bacterium]|nr:hypothetical protein [Bacillota bacterium]
MVEILKSQPFDMPVEYTGRHGVEAYAAVENGVPICVAIFSVESTTTELLDIKLYGKPEDAIYYDAILRAIAFYSKEHGVLTVSCKNREAFNVLEPFGFKGSDLKIEQTCDELLKKNCG